MWAPIAVTLTGMAALAAATPMAPGNILGRDQDIPTSTLPPCAQISVLLNDYDKNGPIPTSVPADIAYECLYSMPINVTSAKQVLFDVPVYINWQSTLDVLKNPPAEYVDKVQAPVDILAGLDAISKDIDDGTILSEYDFGWRLYTLIGAAHDGHFAYIMDVVGYPFTFNRPLALVSVSEDGSKLPAVFAYYDILGLQFKNITYTPSSIVKIDDIDVDNFLEALSQEGGLQDRDALYNNLFYNLAQISLGSSGTSTGMFTGQGRARYVPLTANTTVEFANGSTSVIQNYAETYMDFSNITSGEDLRRKIVYNEGGQFTGSAPPNTFNPSSKISDGANSPDGPSEVSPGYPDPVISGPSGLINGFYIDAPGYEDVAVLVVSSFVSSEYAELPFQTTSKKFLEKAWSEGKTKLIIDVQANGGGTILQG